MKKIKVKTSDIITQKELENGIWQFMLDHAEPFGENLWQVKYLPITTKENLISRIYSRATYLYKIKDEEKIEKELKNKIAYLKSLEVGAKLSSKKQAQMDRLRNKSRLKYNIIIYLRKVANKLMNKWCHEI